MRAVNNIRPVGFFESQPDVDPSGTSPRARFNFSGVCLPTLFAPRLRLSDAEETEIERVLEVLRAEARAHALNLAEFMKPFDKTNRGSVTTARFVRQLKTQFSKPTAEDAALLCKAYAAPDDNVRYAALSKDIGVGQSDPDASSSARRQAHGPLSPNAKLALRMEEALHSDEVRAGFQLLLRTLHERRLRISDTLNDFGRFSPFPGRITKDQLIRGLCSVGGPVASIRPEVMAAMAGAYALRSDPAWCDYVACIRDLEATTYLRHLEAQDPDTLNETFSRSVAASPNPRFVKPVHSERDAAEVQELLRELKDKCARNRVFNVRIFASQYDLTKEGFLTRDRFLRVLSTLHVLPPTQRGVELLIKQYDTAKGLDYSAFCDRNAGCACVCVCALRRPPPFSPFSLLSHPLPSLRTSLAPHRDHAQRPRLNLRVRVSQPRDSIFTGLLLYLLTYFR